MLNILIPVGIGVGAYFLLRKKPQPQPQAVSGEFYVVSGPFPHDAPFHSHFTGQTTTERIMHSGYRPYRPMAGFRRR